MSSCNNEKKGKSYPKTVCAGIVLVWVAVAIWPEVIGIVVILISGVGLLISGVVLGMKTKTTIFGTPIPGCDIFDFGWLSAAPVILGAILFGILFMSNTLHLF